MSTLTVRLNVPAALACVGGFCLTMNAAASSYGVFDARALSMAGTAVAVGDVNQAHHYNPSLIAFHEGHEDRTQDGRHSLALVANRISDGAQAAAEAIADDLEGDLSRAIDQLNDVPTTQAAQVGIEAARGLEQAMHDLNDKVIEADGYVGYSITLPADGEGGAFFVGSRILGIGSSSISESDFDLLDDYLEALQYIATEGAEGAPHPELFNEQNRLYNPSSRIESSASGIGIVQTELGVSGAKQWQLWGVPVALGMAPKLVHLQSYGESWRTVEGEFDSNSFDARSFYLNMDVGATVVFAERYRVALAVKDLRSKSFTVAPDRRVRLQPRTRLGLAYDHPKLRLGLDLDLSKHANPQTQVDQQKISVGAEYQPLQMLKLRLGYQHDLEQQSDDRSTVGLGFKLGRVSSELAYSHGESGNGAAVQFSFYQ